MCSTARIIEGDSIGDSTMNTTKVCSSGARRAGTWQILALCGVLIVAGFLTAAFTAAGAEAARAGDFQFAAAPAAADPPACSGDGIYLYDDINYSGRCGKFTGSAAALADWNFDDLASSLKLAGSYGDGRYRVTLCENTGYAGACSNYLADDPWLGDDAIGNDRPNSAKIEVNTNCTGDGVYLYEDRDYWGRCWKWTADDPLFDEEYFHDRASSIRFMGSYGDGRYTATLYQDLNYGGASTAFGADDPWLGDDAIGNNQADAIRIRTVPACTGDGVYLYEGENYTGRCRNFAASEPYLDNVAFADIASSVRLAGSYAGGDTKVTLCENARYGGACSTFAGNDANLGDDGVGDDRASSLLTEPLCSAVTEIPQVECRALVALYNSTDGPHWTNRNGWLVTNTPCTTPWYGIVCASDRVNILGLRYNGLSGAIPAQLGDLTSLGVLDLAANGLSGAIPAQLGNLTSLKELHLRENQISGAIPPQLGNLTNLTSLSLYNNRLSGAIPPQLGELTSLQHFEL